MKGMIFAAGLGTRLHPLTLTRPKALVEVGGETMLGKVIAKLKASGINELVINVHHCSDMIKQYIAQNDSFGLKIDISDESDCLLDTGGGLKKAVPFLLGDTPVVVHNADILTDFSLEEMMTRHEDTGADVTLMVSERESSRHLLFNSDGRMCGWHNNKTGEYKPSGLVSSGLREFAFGGVHILSQKALNVLREYAPESNVFSIVPFYIDKCKELDIRCYEPKGEFSWFDIGRPATLEAARIWAGQ